MKLSSFAVIVLLSACNLLTGASAARAEYWPTLEDYVAKCVLIVKARTVGDNDNRLSFQVLESWKGKEEPRTLLQMTADGRFFANKGEHGLVDVAVGQEVVFFFTRHNQPPVGKLTSHSTAFPVRQGKVVYASTSRLGGLRKEYTVEQFKKAVEAAVKKQAGSGRAETPPARRGERRPPLRELVERCVLIVKCKIEVKNEVIHYRVVETWKGKYSPDLFYDTPPKGYVYRNGGTLASTPVAEPVEGREVIFFFARTGQPAFAKGKLARHDDWFVVVKGKVVVDVLYEPQSQPETYHDRMVYTVDEFKKAVLAAANPKP